MTTAPTETPDLTRALEDYLETIYLLARDAGYARVRDIANARHVKAGSVSPALKRLADLGLIDYQRREYIALTRPGEMAARRVLARHRILTRFFHRVLQMPADSAEEQACTMEHSLSAEAMDQLVRLFEFLTVCPRGVPDFLDTFHRCSLVHDDVSECEHDCPVPGARSKASSLNRSVYDLKPGQQGRVTQVNASGAIRQRLLDMGILPEAIVVVERVAPAGDPIWIKLHGFQLALRRAEAESVRVIADERAAGTAA